MSEPDAPRRLTADDVVNYPLKQSVRGYSVQQVDELLDRVADELERIGREVDDAQGRLTRSERRLQEASETEATLKRTLVTAQRAAEQSIEEAKERAAEILDEARREAAALLEQARLDAEEMRVEAVQAARAEEAEIRRRRQTLESHIEALRVFERDYRARLREHLEHQLQTLDDLDARPAPPTVDLDEPAPAPPGPPVAETEVPADPATADGQADTPGGPETGAGDDGDDAVGSHGLFTDLREVREPGATSERSRAEDHDRDEAAASVWDEADSEASVWTEDEGPGAGGASMRPGV